MQGRKGGVEIFLMLGRLALLMVTVEGEVGVHLADYRMVLGAEVEAGHGRPETFPFAKRWRVRTSRDGWNRWGVF